MKRFILFLAAGLVSAVAMAQDFPYGKVDDNALNMKQYNNDTSAHAVVLNEHGTSRIQFNNDYRIIIIFDYHVTKKFFDAKDFEGEGTFEIPVYSRDNQVYEEVQDIKGVTFYKDESGNLQKEELDSKKIFRTQDSKHWTIVKFTMPALRKGCVIEVNYKVVSPFLFNFHSWDFQGHIPKINSEYEVHIPGFWDYNASLKGYLKLTTSKSNIEQGCFTYGTGGGIGTGAVADCSHIIYGISDVPAFKPEDYMTSEKNFLSSVNFQLIQETDMTNGVKSKYTKEWKDIDYFLKSLYGFGTQLKRKELFKERTLPLVAAKTDQLEKAKIIYDYIRNNIKWDKRNSSESVDGIKQALDNHAGNAGDINISLVTALNAAGIPTEAVLLSTREHGTVNKLYPAITSFNYVIAKANIGDKSYLLDATDPLLSFGMLPLRCLNDQGRAYSLDKPSYWIDLTTNQQQEKTVYSTDLTLQADGKLKGTITRFSTGYSGYLKRVAIKKFNTIDEYAESLSENSQKIKILKTSIGGLDSLDMPVRETFEVEINAHNNLNSDKLGLDPFILNKITTNPFKLTERDYPVDMGMPSDERYILTVHLPQLYTIENPPQTVAFALPNQGGKFVTDFQVNAESNTFTFSNVTQFNQSIYGPDEYPYLKELFNKIILTEKNNLTFKKKS